MKTLQWTDWARDRLLPLPGEAWTLNVDLKKAEKAVPKAGGGQVPAAPTVKDEVQRAVSLRVHERYNPQGNHPRDTAGRDLVDVWCARRGVAFATEVVVATCQQPREKATDRVYQLRLDGQPWGGSASTSPSPTRRSERPRGRSRRRRARPARRASCPSRSPMHSATRPGSGRRPAGAREGVRPARALTALTDAKKLREALVFLLGETEEYQLVENLYPHMPTVLHLLADADAPLVVRAGGQAWNKATRKPWLEIVGCLQAPAAKAFVKKHA